MKKAKKVAGHKCPLCDKTEYQVNAGKIAQEHKGDFAKTAKNTTHLPRKHDVL